MTETGFKKLIGFPKAFWVVNGIELLERGAYYSFNAVFFVFMSQLFQSNGMTAASAVGLAGLISSIVFLLLYTVPVLAAPFAEKYGYRASLAVVFALLVAGYFMALVSTTIPMIIATAILIGVGAGIFKPIPAAVVTQTSDEEKRGLAFSIYYACINIGALVFPLSLGVAGIFFPERLFQITFAASAALAAANLILSLFLFRNLRAPQKDKSVGAALATLGDIVHYPSFLVLMVIYAGFWFMYVLALTVLGQYMLDFQRMPGWFNLSLLQTINPAVIILGAPILGTLATRFKPLVMMIVGISIYALGLVTIGFSTTSVFFVIGVLAYSIGELFTHPAYLGYVSRIAPPEKASVFLGYGFIPIGVGQFLGSLVGATVYGRLALNGQPALYWALMAGIGVLTAAALVIFNHFVTPRAAQPETKRRGVPGAIGAFGVALLALLLGGAVIAAATVAPTTQPLGAASTDDPLDAASLATVALDPIEGEAAEGERASQTVTFPAEATGSATFTLTWEDEAAGAGTTNQPDSFRIHVMAPDGTMTQSEESATGSLELTIEGIVPGDYTIEVELVDAGDSSISGVPGILPVPVPGSQPDTGNAFTLEVSHQVPK